MESIKWERYPRLAGSGSAKAWMTIQINLGLARNTVEAYGRALEDHLTFCERHALVPESIGQADVASYVHDLSERPGTASSPSSPKNRRSLSRRGVAAGECDASATPYGDSPLLRLFDGRRHACR
jgi:hypothetical protein